MKRPEFMVEDRVWYVPDGADFAILATVTGVSRAIHPGSFYFYEIDEPVGHGIPEEQLCLEKYRDDVEHFLRGEAFNKQNMSAIDRLKKWRKQMTEFIYSTHVKIYGENTSRWPWMEEGHYPERTEGDLIIT